MNRRDFLRGALLCGAAAAVPAAVAEALAPRGVSYIVFEDLPIDQLGGRYAQYTYFSTFAHNIAEVDLQELMTIDSWDGETLVARRGNG